MAWVFQENLLSVLPQLRAYALSLTRSRANADDLLQETALKAWRAQSQFIPGTNFKAWMYCILRNEFISSLRRNKRVTVPIDQVPEEFLARAGDQDNKIILAEVMRAAALLQKPYREVLLLICMNGASYDEAAEILGCSIGTIKSRLWRAREQMHKMLMGEEGAETVPALNSAAADSHDALRSGLMR